MFDQIIDNILYNFYTLNFAVATGTADIVFDLICLKKKEVIKVLNIKVLIKKQKAEKKL